MTMGTITAREAKACVVDTLNRCGVSPALYAATQGG